MLDDLWDYAITSTEEREAIYNLTSYLVDNELLWAPLVQFEENKRLFASLVSKQVLQFQDNRIGFRHQTLLEHAKARLFTKEDRSLCDYLLKLQDAILVRPTAWAVLRYLRSAHPAKYRTEIEKLFASTLRLHLRYLLIEFLGQVSQPEEYEVALLGNCVMREDERVRVLLSIRGNPGWFHAFQAAYFPSVMQGTLDKQWPMVGIFADAWDFDRKACLTLIEKYWLPFPEKDILARQALSEIGKWDERAVDIACTLIRRTEDRGERLYWAESLVYAISADKPDLAPRVFIETAVRMAFVTGEANTRPKRRAYSPLESGREWFELPAVAEAAPAAFLRATWKWVVEICEEYHRGPTSSVVNYYGGSCLSLDERPHRPEPAVLTSICTAIDGTAEASPETFMEITRDAWTSENAIVHRLLARGLAIIARKLPEVGMKYLAGDARRLLLGTYESHQQSDSVKLVNALGIALDPAGRKQLEDLILSWSMYRDDAAPEGELLKWDRENRLRILNAIPVELLSPDASELLKREKQEIPQWDRQVGGVRVGFVRHLAPISKDEMLSSTNEHVLKAIEEAPERDESNKTWIEVEGGWEEPGGAHAAGHELSELAKENPHRAIDLVNFLLAKGREDVVTQAINSFSESALSDAEIFDFVQSLISLAPKTEELRSNIGYLLYRRARSGTGLPNDLCVALGHWLAEPWDSDHAVFQAADQTEEDDPSTNVEPILWSVGGGIVDTDRSFWPLLAITEGYIMRYPPDYDAILLFIDKHLDRNIAERTWAAYCSELRWVGRKDCDHTRGEDLVAKLFARFPAIAQEREGIVLVANISHVLSESFLRRFLDNLRQSPRFKTRQAYGELLTLIAIRGEPHKWATDKLGNELSGLADQSKFEEAVAIGLAFSAAHLWDEPEARPEASRVLCHLLPVTTDRIGRAIATMFWTDTDFVIDAATEDFLHACANHPEALSKIEIAGLVEHLIPLIPQKRVLVLDVCNSILKAGHRNTDMFEAGPHLVKISMTLQRFADTRDAALSLLEQLLRLGLDDAFRILHEIDIRPTVGTPRVARPRRRRRRRPPSD